MDAASRHRPDAQFLYRVFGRAWWGRPLLYVGITCDPARRMAQHASEKPWWPEVERVEVELLGTITHTQARTIERQVILTERPRYNLEHNGRSARRRWRAERRARARRVLLLAVTVAAILLVTARLLLAA